VMLATCEPARAYGGDGRDPSSSLSASLTERDLAHLWEGQRFPPRALATIGGHPLKVLYRGLRGRGPGPDYRDAVIRAPWGVLKGDVELHVRASDFRRHGHHRDAAYDGLALHLVHWHDEQEETALAGGRRVPVAALAPWVEHRSAEIRGWLQRPALWEEPCRSARDRIGGGAVAAVLDRLGDIRFRRMSVGLRRVMDRLDPDEALYRATLESLGYGGNREAFGLLAARLTWRDLQRTLRGVPVEDRAAAAEEMLAEAVKRPPAIVWRTAGTRPGNRAAGRLRAAAVLAARHADAGLARGMGAIMDGGVSDAIASLTVKARGQTLIGAGRAVEILTNVLLPFFAAGMEPRSGRALEMYRELRRPSKYGCVRHLDEAVGAAVRVDARRQQGMLFLLHSYCRMGRCGSCPIS
jgi:hypothetical protein